MLTVASSSPLPPPGLRWTTRTSGALPVSPAHKHRFQDVSLNTFPWIMLGLQRAEIIQVKNLDELPSEAATDKRILTELNNNSLICIPMMTAGSVIGFLGVSSTEPVDQWPADTTAMLRVVTNILVAALERKKAEAERERLIRELKHALAKVKMLKGMLPICAGCKNIRDDEGYWRSVEVYIRDHSDVEFTHAMCPNCAKQLYPEIYEDDA